MLSPENSNLHISGFDNSVTEEILCQTFAAYGAVTSVKIMVYPSHLTGFVAFAQPAAAEAARSALNGSTLGGRVITVVWARKPPGATGRLRAEAEVLAADSSSSLERSLNADAVAVPPSAVTRARISVVAKLVAEHGSLMEQAAERLRESKEAHDMSFMSPKNSWHNYYLCKVIQHAYALHDRTPPDLIQIDRDKVLRCAGLPADVNPADPSLGLSSANIRFYNAMVATEVESLKVASLLSFPSGTEVPKLPPAYTADLTTFLVSLSSLDRNSYTIKLATAEALELNVPLVAHGIASHLIAADTLDMKMAAMYLIHDILCNITCDVSSAWRFKPVFIARLPSVFGHLRAVAEKIKESGRSVAAVHKRVYLMLAIWRACSIFSLEFLDGLEITYNHQLHIPVYGKNSSTAPPKNSTGDHDGECLDTDMFDNLALLPIPLRREFYDVYKSRDDIWALRSMCQKNGVPHTLTDHPTRLMQVLLEKIAYSQQRVEMPPPGPTEPLNPATILAHKR